jgi:hypothetical protein
MNSEIYGNAQIHKRTFIKANSRSRRRCNCGCNQRASHIGLANDVAMTMGCELYIRRWVKGNVIKLLRG